MEIPLLQHQREIQANRQAWERKPLLQEAYRQLYQKLLDAVDPRVPGRIVEIGSGIGNLRSHLPAAICSDLFPNPWLDLVCDAYALPFRPATLSHLILMDVFHHLEAPALFFQEAGRVLAPGGRVLLMEPFISLSSYLIYGLFHHEPVGWRTDINLDCPNTAPKRYYASQGNATRLFFRGKSLDWPTGWRVLLREAFAASGYLLSGGFRGPLVGRLSWAPWLRRLDLRLSRWPRVFGIRCLVVLQKTQTLC